MKKRKASFPTLCILILLSLNVNAANIHNSSISLHNDRTDIEEIVVGNQNTESNFPVDTFIVFDSNGLENECELDAGKLTNKLRAPSYETFFNLSYLINNEAYSDLAVPFGFDGNIRSSRSLGYGNMYARECSGYSALDFVNGGSRGSCDEMVDFLETTRFRKIAQRYNLNKLDILPYKEVTSTNRNEDLISTNTTASSTTLSKPKNTLSIPDRSGPLKALAATTTSKKEKRSKKKRKKRKISTRLPGATTRNVNYNTPQRNTASFSTRSSITPSSSRTSSTSAKTVREP